MRLAQEHNTVTLVRLEPAAPRSRYLNELQRYSSDWADAQVDLRLCCQTLWRWGSGEKSSPGSPHINERHMDLVARNPDFIECKHHFSAVKLF